MDGFEGSKRTQNFKFDLIDHATRYSATTAVKSKQKEEIVGPIFEICICSNLKYVFARTTPAEFSWSNGMTERHNAILANMNDKLLLDKSSNYPIDVIFT